MPEIALDLPGWLEATLLAGAAATALLAIAAAIRRAGRAMRTAGVWLAGVVGEAVREVVREEMAPIRNEVFPNGGQSLRDAVDRTGYDVARLTEWAVHHDPEGFGPTEERNR